MDNSGKKIGFWGGTFKVLMMGLLVLLLLIPMSFVKNLITERQNRRENVISEVRNKWGRRQIFCGPVLTLPYQTEKQITSNSTVTTELVTSYLHILPEMLDYQVQVAPQERYRSIFKVIVYQASLNVNGNFILPDLHKIGIKKENILWDNAVVSMRVSDFRGLQKTIQLDFDDKKANFESGSDYGLKNSVSASPEIDENKSSWNFAFDVKANGSTDLKFIPLGKVTNVEMTSSWPNPSFIGDFLPDERNISSEGFTANWEVLELNRPMNQVYYGKKILAISNEYGFGVNFYIPVNLYQKSERSAKYALLIISLVFITFFTVTLINKVQINPVHYMLIGAALCVFYSLLLSISEYTGFNTAYWIAAAVTALLLGTYGKAIVKKNMYGMSITAVILFIYTFIYIIIQLKDYSLMLGSIGLFLIVAILMYLSIKLKAH